MLRLLFIVLIPFTLSAQLKRFQFSESKMGSPFNLIFYHNDSVEALSVAKECFSIVDSLNAVFSDYTTESETGKLNSSAVHHDIKVSDELFAMIVQSKKAWLQSEKTFDISIGALSRLWRKAKRENKFPKEATIKKVKQSTGFENITINEKTKTISLRKPGIKFDFGGIVPGYAAQKVIDYLKSKNIHQALVDASGDIVISDAPPGKNGWSIGINLPESENEVWDSNLELNNCAVSTSGDVYRYIVYKGKKYSHIIDPRTGYGVTSQRNVTVIAKNGATGDWLATACSILSIEKALALAKKEKAELLIATLQDEKIITYKTEGFDSYFRPKLP